MLRIAFVFAVLFLAGIPSSASRADDFGALPQFLASLNLPKGRAEFSSGFDATGNGWSSYASAVFGLSGPLHRDGWRLKIAGLYGSSTYETRHTYCPLSAEEKKQLTGTNFSDICNDIANDPPQGDERAELSNYLAPYYLELDGDQIIAAIPHMATRYLAGVAPGYQTSLGRLILKAYLGLAFEQYDVLPEDRTRSLNGGYWGAQSWLEAWLPIDDDSWLSADASYFTGTSSYSAAAKLGYKPLSWLALGPELAAYGDTDDMSGRAGVFLRVDGAGVETTIAGGISGAYKDDPGAYGTANMYMRF